MITAAVQEVMMVQVAVVAEEGAGTGGEKTTPIGLYGIGETIP
jgi:hypothetical protein